ncbi:MAG: hypothetical protein NZ522_07260, partial [Chitinophagales bacterium]|nr:hypothetical protein [Chitinophagales bacterium]
TGELEAKINISLKKEDYSQRIKSAINKLAREVALKGFRPGMAPVAHIKKLYGNAVLAEELFKTLDGALTDYLKQNNIKHLAQPMPVTTFSDLNVSIDNLKDIFFSYEIGLQPYVDLSFLNSEPTFTKYKIRVEEKFVDEELEKIRKQYGEIEYPDSAEKNDILFVKLEETDEAGNLIEQGYSTKTYFLFDRIKPEYHHLFEQLKVGQSIDINVYEYLSATTEEVHRFVLNLKDDQQAPIHPTFKLTLEKVTRRKPAEMNEVFFKAAFPDQNPQNEEEVRSIIKSDIEAYFDGKSEALLEYQILNILLQRIDMALPDNFLKKWMKYDNKDFTDEQIEANYPEFAKKLRWDLINHQILKEQNLEVNREDIFKQAYLDTVRLITNYYGKVNFPQETIFKLADEKLTDKDYAMKMYDRAVKEKVMQYIKSKVKIEESQISLDEFNQLVDKENESLVEVY